jgi:hypothetical protein
LQLALWSEGAKYCYIPFICETTSELLLITDVYKIKESRGENSSIHLPLKLSHKRGSTLPHIAPIPGLDVKGINLDLFPN